MDIEGDKGVLDGEIILLYEKVFEWSFCKTCSSVSDRSSFGWMIEFVPATLGQSLVLNHDLVSPCVLLQRMGKEDCLSVGRSWWTARTL